MINLRELRKILAVTLSLSFFSIGFGYFVLYQQFVYKRQTSLIVDTIIIFGSIMLFVFIYPFKNQEKN